MRWEAHQVQSDCPRVGPGPALGPLISSWHLLQPRLVSTEHPGLPLYSPSPSAFFPPAVMGLPARGQRQSSGHSRLGGLLQGGRRQQGSQKCYLNTLAMMMLMNNGAKTMACWCGERMERLRTQPRFSVCPLRLGFGVLPRGSTSQRSQKAEARTSPTL